MKTVKLNKIGKLKEINAVETDLLEISPDRGKAIGRMWRGKCALFYNDITFNFEMWHHGSEKETKESLQEHFKLDSIVLHEKFYDANWHIIFSTFGIYFHRKGWFPYEELRNKPIINNLPNSNIYAVELTDGEKALLISLGFILIVKF